MTERDTDKSRRQSGESNLRALKEVLSSQQPRVVRNESKQPYPPKVSAAPPPKPPKR